MEESIVNGFFGKSAYATPEALARLATDFREVRLAHHFELCEATWGDTKQPKLCLFGLLTSTSARSRKLPVPIQIWISHQYPVEPPTVYVVNAPFADDQGQLFTTKVALNNPVVDSNGLCYARELACWSPRESSLLGLVKALGQLLLETNESILVIEKHKPPKRQQDSSSKKGICEGKECLVCFGERDTVLVPCGHYCLCNSCAANITACPACRAVIQFRQRIHDV